jgi:hypothetical protein
LRILHHHQKRNIMKRFIVFTIVLTLIFMSGCLVSSLHPFYKTTDKYFDSAMVGSWIDGDSCIWTIVENRYSRSFMGPEKSDSTYQITYYEEDSSKAVLKGTLFQLNRVSYVDFIPDPNEDHCYSDMTSFHLIPVHTLARVQYNKDSILMYWYGDEWLNELFEQNRIRIKHETIDATDYDRHVLTASTDELQKFIKKYANDPKTVQEIEQIFAKGTTDDQEEYGVFLKLKPYHGPLPEKDAKWIQSN